MEDKNSIKFKSQIYAATRAQYNTIIAILELIKVVKTNGKRFQLFFFNVLTLISSFFNANRCPYSIFFLTIFFYE